MEPASPSPRTDHIRSRSAEVRRPERRAGADGGGRGRPSSARREGLRFIQGLRARTSLLPHMAHIPIATHDPKSPNVTISILPEDLRRSMYVVGKTGVGKSALLERLLLGAVDAGFGACLIDPHGELADRVLGLLPRPAVPRVVRFAPKDAYPVGLNLLAGGEATSRALIASQLVDVFRKLWGQTLFGPRSEHLLRNSVLVLLENPGTTLPCLGRMLVDEPYRAKLLERVTDPVVRLFWTQEFPGLGRSMQAEVTAPVLNKLGALSTPAVRRVLGQPKPRLSVRDAMDEGRIIVADLSGIGRDAAQLLGALLVAQVTIAAHGRAGTPEAAKRPCLVVADEFPAYATSSFTELLSEGRKFGLAAVLAHQFTAQIPRELLASILGNAGTLVAFRVSAQDAEALEPEFAPELTARHLVQLKRFRIALKLLRGGEPVPPFICHTPPPGVPSRARRDTHVRVSRQRYGRAAARTDRDIAAALAVTESAGSAVGGPRSPRRSSGKSGGRGQAGRRRERAGDAA
jgi:hypothetical protein